MRSNHHSKPTAWRYAVVLLALPLLIAATARKKTARPTMRLEAIPWEFELPHGYLVNRFLSRKNKVTARPALLNKKHLAALRREFKKGKIGLENIDNSAWTLDIKSLSFADLDACTSTWVKWRQVPGRPVTPRIAKLKIHGHAARRIHMPTKVGDWYGLLLFLGKGQCLIFDAGPPIFAKHLTPHNARALDRIKGTLRPSGTDEGAGVFWQDLGERHFFDGFGGAETPRKTR